MSRQNSMESYFKPAVNYDTHKNMSNVKRTRSDHIKCSSKKSSKLSPHLECDIILVSSDDSDEADNTEISKPNKTETENLIPPGLINVVPMKKICKSPQKSPRSAGKKKFYSPTKKRLQSSKIPNPAKRSLSFDAVYSSTETSLMLNRSNSESSEIFEGIDDKTNFLLQTINKCMAKENLKHLLPDECRTLILKYSQLQEPGLRLVNRLYWYQECWYSKKKLIEILSKKSQDALPLSPDVIIDNLIDDGFLTGAVTQDNSMNFEDLVKTLNLSDVKFICKHFKLKCQSKDCGIKSLRSFIKQKISISSYFGAATPDNSSRVLRLMREKAGPCYKLSTSARWSFYQLYVLMFLGIDYSIIRDKKLELMLINEKIRKETFPVTEDMGIDDASVVFESRHEFQRYIAAHSLNEEYMKKLELADKYNLLKIAYEQYKAIDEADMNSYKSMPMWLYRFTPPYVFLKLLEHGVQDLKKERSAANMILALSILTSLTEQSAFRQHRRAEWYAEKALILHKDFCSHDDAAKVLLEGFKSNIPIEDKDILRPRAKNIANHKSIVLSEQLRSQLLDFATKDEILEKNIDCNHIYKAPMDSNSKGKLKFETRRDGCRIVQGVEEFCKMHYIDSGDFTHGEHWEGRFILTIFFLLFWEIIYGKVRGVRGIFLSRYQRVPSDLYSGDFYHNRKTLIEDRLRFIEQSSEETVLSIMHDVWHSRSEGEISGISRELCWERTRQAARCACGEAGSSRLAALCRRVARAPLRARAGFPDLTLWNVHDKKIKFVEVKTDADKPSTKQLQWLQYLRECGFDAELCYVGVNTTRCRARAQPI